MPRATINLVSEQPLESAGDDWKDELLAGVPDCVLAFTHYGEGDIPDLYRSMEMGGGDDLLQKMHRLREHATDILEPVDNKALLEFYWYQLRFFLFSLSNCSQGKSAAHLWDQIMFFVMGMEHAKTDGHLDIASAYEEMERRLLTLAKTHPDLRPGISKLLAPDAWTKLHCDAHEKLYAIEERHFASGSGDRVQGWEKDMRLQQDIQTALNMIRDAMTPLQYPEAWEEPLVFLEENAGDSRVVFVEPRYIVEVEEGKELPYALAFDFQLLEQMAETRGFCRWMLSDAQNIAIPIGNFFEQHQRGCSLPELLARIERYLNDRRSCRFREYMMFPDEEEPGEVAVTIRLWEEIRAVRRRAQSTIELFNSATMSGVVRLRECLRRTEKALVFGENAYVPDALEQHLPRSDVSIFAHHLADQHVPTDHLCVPGCVSGVAYEIGQKSGWGPLQSSAVPLQENDRLGRVLQSPLFQRGSHHEGFLRIPRHDGKFFVKDAVIFTCEDEEEEAEDHAPVGVSEHVSW